MRPLALFIAACLLAVSCSSSGDEPQPPSASVQGGRAQPTVFVEAPTPLPDPDEPVPIRIVALMAETNVLSTLDRPTIEGARLQVDALNEAGGLLGRPIEFEVVDTRSQLSVADQAAMRELRAGVDLLLVTCDPEFAAPILEQAEAAGVLSISPCSGDAGFAEARYGNLAFSFGVSATTEGTIAADEMLARGARGVIVLRDETNPEAEEFCDSFTSRFVAGGGFVIFEDAFTYDSPEPFEDRLKQRETAADVVALCSHVPGGQRGAPAIIQIVRDAGITAPFVGGSTLDGTDWILDGSAIGSMTVVALASVYGDDPDPGVNEVTGAIDELAAVGLSRGVAITGVDAVDAFARAVTATGTVDGPVLAARLEQFSAELFLSGPVTFGPGVHSDPDRALRVLQVEGGEGRFLATRSPG